METLETLQRGNCRCGVRSEGARLSRRRALRAGLAPAGAALLAGACGLPFGAGAGSAPADLPPPSQAPATVTYLSATDAQRQQLEQELFADVSRELPHITLTVSNVASWDQVKEQFVAGNAAGTPVGLAQAGWVGPWLDLWKQGAVVDQTPYFKRDKIDPAATFVEPALTSWLTGGKLAGMPVTTSVDALAYNVALFADLDLRSPPVDPSASWWTLETFLNYARQLTDRSKPQFGFGGRLATGNVGGVTTGTYFGQGPWDDTKKKCQMDAPDFQKGLQFWKEAADLRRVQPNDAEAARLRGGQDVDVFSTGKVAMQVVSDVQTPLSFKWALTALPYSGPPGSKNVSGRTQTHALLMGQTKGAEREAAWQVLHWLQRPANAARLPRIAGHVVSPFKDPAASELVQQLYKDQLRVDAKAYLLQAQTARPVGWGMVKYAGFGKVGPEMDRRYVQEFLADKMSVQDYATWVTKYVNGNLGA